MQVLRCERLSKAFDGVKALDSFTLQLPESGIVAIIGPNGAGKTTLINVITGFLRPDGGRCLLGDRDITQLAPHKISRLGVTRTFQDLRLVRLISAIENVMLARPNQLGERLGRALTRLGVGREEKQNRAEAERLLDFVGLANHANALAGQLSYGQQKLLTLACCLATESSILILDEPVAGVHPDMVERILELLGQLKAMGKLVVFIEHDIGAVRKAADKVCVMDEGRLIAQGVPGDVLERPEIMEAFVG